MDPQDQDFTALSAQKLNGYLAFRNWTAGGAQFSAWRERQGRFFVELRADRTFRFAAPSLAQAEEALLQRLETEA